MLTWCALVNAKTAMICCRWKPRPAPPMQVHSWLDGIVSIVLLIFGSLLLCVYSLVSSETFRSDARIRRTRKKKRKFGHQSRSYLQNPVNVLYSRQAQQWFMTFLRNPPGFLLLFILLHNKGRRSGLYQSHNWCHRRFANHGAGKTFATLGTTC